MEKEKVSAGQRITVGEITLLPIMRTFLYCRNVDGRIVYSGSKNLIGIVVVSPKGKRAINLDGEEIPVDQYLEQVPEITELIQSI